MEYTLRAIDFEQFITSNDKPILVDFWASWCGPCKMLAPIISEIASERDDILVAKVNVDDERALAMKYKISAIPTVLCFKKGEIVNQHVGYAVKDDILNLLK